MSASSALWLTWGMAVGAFGAAIAESPWTQVVVNASAFAFVVVLAIGWHFGRKAKP